jgi:hypothetical protein
MRSSTVLRLPLQLVFPGLTSSSFRTVDCRLTLFEPLGNNCREKERVRERRRKNEREGEKERTGRVLDTKRDA